MHYSLPVTRSSRLAIAFCCTALSVSSSIHAQCIAVGPHPAATSVNVAFGGSDYAFNNPLNCLASDGNRASAASVVSLLSGQTDYLQATDFGFNIPAAATICGIEANIEKSATNLLLNLTSVADYRVYVVKNGARTGTNMAHTNVVWSEDTDANSTYGNNATLWGTTWSPADINNANFGIAISAEIGGIIGLLPAARINYISMTVHYLDPSALNAQSIQLNAVNGNDKSVVLTWKPVDIAEATAFAIERSANGSRWEPLPGASQKNVTTNLYSFTDVQPLPGKSFYRLKMLNSTGQLQYSTALPFTFNDNSGLKCYPNPFTTGVQVSGVLTGEQVSLTNSTGQCVYLSAPAVNSTITIYTHQLQPGMYIVSAGNRKMKLQKH